MTEFDENEDGGIFTNREDVLEAQRKSAEAIGLDPKVVEKEQTGLFAKKSCKYCYGRGTIVIAPSPQKQKVFSIKKGAIGKFTTRRSRRFPNGRKRPTSSKSVRMITGFSPANELANSWDTREREDGRTSGTRRPEPIGYKSENLSQFLCRCVREKEIA